jgi:hypothetical protein
VLAEEQADLLELLAAEAHFLAVEMSLVDLGLPVNRLWLAHPSVDLGVPLSVIGVSEERMSSVVEISAQEIRHATHPTPASADHEAPRHERTRAISLG